MIKLYTNIVAFATELIFFNGKIILSLGDVHEDC